jgi:hypothetical protein
VKLLDGTPNTDGQSIFDYYLKHWKDEAMSKNFGGDWLVPQSDIDFHPSQWTPPPREGHINPEVFDSATTHF